MAEFVIVTVKI